MKIYKIVVMLLAFAISMAIVLSTGFSMMNKDMARNVAAKNKAIVHKLYQKSH